ncbi:MAG: carbohydrate-binding protein, partial [Bacteroidota bacterium]
RDKVLAAKDHAELADASMVGTPVGMLGKQLIANSDCMACHKEVGESIGPSYQKVAQRYQGDETARDMLAGKIVQGGSGNWGEVAMAAHPGISTQQATQMADYILSLSDDTPRSSQYPPKGTYTSRSHLEKNPYGSYVLTASYTDQGGQAVGSLSVQQSLLLRHPRIEAEDYDEGQAMKFPVKAEDTPGIDEDMTIVVGQHGKSFMFRNIDLTGVAAIKGQFGMAPGITKGGTVEYRLDAPDGELLGSAELEQGLTTMGFKEPVTAIEEVSGKHDIYVVFVGEKDDEEVLVAVVNWIEFLNQVSS